MEIALRNGILACVAAAFLALSSSAQAQKTVLPGMQTTPPPKQVLPGSPTTPPPMRSPDMDTTLGRSAPSTEGGYRNAPAPSAPGLSREEARRRFEQCINQNTRNGTLNGPSMANCVGGWMPPQELSRFNNCWNDPKTSAWECSGRAYN